MNNRTSAATPLRSWTKDLPVQVTVLGDPILRQICDEQFFDDANAILFQDLVRVMLLTMRASSGVGIAANQIGLPFRVIAVADRAILRDGVPHDLFARQKRTAVAPYGVVNPVITPDDRAGQDYWFEGCLSVPDYTAIVPRFNQVRLTGQRPDGTEINMVVDGWHARILQHEVDHLNGCLYVDRMAARTFMHKSEYVKRFRAKLIPDVMSLLGATFNDAAPLSTNLKPPF